MEVDATKNHCWGCAPPNAVVVLVFLPSLPSIVHLGSDLKRPSQNEQAREEKLRLSDIPPAGQFQHVDRGGILDGFEYTYPQVLRIVHQRLTLMSESVPLWYTGLFRVLPASPAWHWENLACNLQLSFSLQSPSTKTKARVIDVVSLCIVQYATTLIDWMARDIRRTLALMRYSAC